MLREMFDDLLYYGTAINYFKNNFVNYMGTKTFYNYDRRTNDT